MANAIVQVNVSQTIAPLPNTLQQTGAFISQGGTTLTAGTLLLLTQAGSLATYLAGAAAVSSLSWASNVVTVTTTQPHGLQLNETGVNLVLAGVTPVGYNGVHSCTITGANTFTYAASTNPGTATTPGTYTAEDVGELVQMNTTFFAQGSNVPVYVLELGDLSPADGVAALTTWIAANPGTIYSYLVPRTWDSIPSFLSLAKTYGGVTGQTYFFATTTVANLANYTPAMKSVFPVIEAPNIGATEFSAAAPFYVTLNYAPTGINRVTPLAFAYVSGVTPYPTMGTSTTMAQIFSANGNLIGTGSEGGISNTILLYGKLADGNAFNYWYAVDWCSINLNISLSNTIINGSNNPLAPLYYDQNGINTLASVSQMTLNRGITYGLLISSVSVTATPFYTYTQANPSAYRAGTYGGLAATVTPTQGFDAITFNLNVSSFPVGG